MSLLALLIAATLPAFPQEPSSEAEQRTLTESYTQFEEGQFHLVVRRPVPANMRNLPAATTQVAASIDDQVVGIFSDAIVRLRVDSLTTARERFRENPELLTRLPEIARNYSRRTVRRANDLSWVEVHYRYELFPTIAELFIRHERPIPMHHLLRWVPSGPYTGIVIYAKEPLPVRGEGTEARLEPALLPEIFTSELEPILAPEMLSGDLVRRRGVVAYTDTVDSATQTARAGENPMYVMANEIFGSGNTDIILHPEDSTAILASESARSVLQEGRVVVILSEQQIRAD